MLSQNRQSKTLLLFLTCLTLLVFSSNSSIASRNGTERQGNTFAVGINFKFSGIDHICSGALIAPKIIVTAAHCLVDENGIVGTDYYFNKPGVALDAPIDPTAKQIKIVKTYLHPGYSTSPDKQKEDIAFIELDTPLATTGFIRTASASELEQLADKQSLTGYGFGYVYETNSSHSNFVRSYPLTWRTAASTVTDGFQVESTSATACAGDSGGPITALTSQGEEILIGVMNRAANVISNCGVASTDGTYTMQATIITSHLSLVPTELLTSSQATTATPAASTKPTTTPTPAKRYKITCLKGKIKKYITGTNPKCPSGYKQIAKVLLSK